MIFHPLNTDIPKPSRLNNPFFYEPHPLCLLATEEVKAAVSARKEWQAEVERGKMFGVLVVERLSGQGSSLGYLAAYSGQILGRSNWEGFVPAVFDYLLPGGYFKTHEQKISLLNAEVERLETDEERQQLKNRLDEQEKRAVCQIEAYKEEMKRAKARRDSLRKAGADALQQEAMRAESQWMKAELHRMKKRFRAERDVLLQGVERFDGALARLKEERKRQSDELQRWLFARFEMRNGRGERCSLLDIFARETGQLPPAGTGECCAPKLLQYAFAHHLRPVCMAEFWMGQTVMGEVRREGCFYPACQGKCGPTLRFMLQGIEVDPATPEGHVGGQLKVVYEDKNLTVVCKPAGMLSVPGKSGAASVYSLMRARYPDAASPLVVHRLDMDTSGLMLIAKTKEKHRNLQSAFKNRAVKKKYVALLEGLLPAEKQGGRISLPLSPDYLDRPRQRVNREKGKSAVTDYEVLGQVSGHSLVALYPQTGRTHQLRVHCAHAEGLNMPILGDALYGRKADRLYLHAEAIEIPSEGISFRIEADF